MPDTTARDPELTSTNEANAWEEALIADMRANGGRPTSGPLEGHPLMLLYSTGAKSGQRRRSILTYSQQDGEYVVAGTAGGSKVDPAWVANLRANPQVEIEIGDRTFSGEAVLLEGAGEERERLWNEHVAQLPWFGDYPEQVGGRPIPMARLRTSAAS